METTATDSSAGGARVVKCQTCESPQAGRVRGISFWDGATATGEFSNPPVEYALVQCESCGDATLQVREDLGFGLDEPFTVYPAPRLLGGGIPEELRLDWAEANKCFEAGAYTASVVMVRRTLEGTCSLHGVTARNLSQALTEMRTNGLIDDTLADWSTALRLAGNKGAHFGEHLTRRDAEDALHFVEAFLNHIYVLRARFDEFQRRLAADKGT